MIKSTAPPHLDFSIHLNFFNLSFLKQKKKEVLLNIRRAEGIEWARERMANVVLPVVY